MKKRKLNSTNPRYQKLEVVQKTNKKLIKEIKGVKIYAIYNI